MSGTLSSVTVIVSNPQGLHMRPADLLVRTACNFLSTVTIEREGQSVDAKSILGILTLGATQGSELILRADGEDADSALSALAALFQRGFDENEE